jgi:hypothetical protein
MSVLPNRLVRGGEASPNGRDAVEYLGAWDEGVPAGKAAGKGEPGLAPSFEPSGRGLVLAYEAATGRVRPLPPSLVMKGSPVRVRASA